MEATPPSPKHAPPDTRAHTTVAVACVAITVISVYGLYPLLGPAVLVVAVGCTAALALLTGWGVSAGLAALMWPLVWSVVPDRLHDTTIASFVLNAGLALALLFGVHRYRELAVELERREVSLRHTLRLAEAGAQVSRVSEAPLTPVQAASVAVRAITGAADLDLVFLAEQDGERMRVHVLHRNPDTHLQPGTTLDEAREAVRRHTRALYRPDYVNDARRDPDLADLVAVGVRGIARVPVQATSGAVKVLVALRLHTVRAWWDDDRNLLEAAARGVRIAAEREAHETALDYDANHDILTGLLNRRAFERDVQWEARYGHRDGFLLAVVDLDGLKRVNDTGGHARGDDLIRAFASLMRAELMPRDSLYRLGGDEFALLMRGDQPHGEHAYRERIEKVELALHASGFPEGGASVGWARWPADGEHAQAVLHAADERMYANKVTRRATRE